MIQIIGLNLRKLRSTSSIFKRDTTSIRAKFWCYLNLKNEGELGDIKTTFDGKLKENNILVLYCIQKILFAVVF